MSHGSDCQETTFAYLSTLESVEHGYFGGYLVLSKLGRPLEFPAGFLPKPSRDFPLFEGVVDEGPDAPRGPGMSPWWLRPTSDGDEDKTSENRAKSPSAATPPALP